LRLQNRENAEDVAQEVFMKAWRSRDTFDQKKSSLKNWLFAIARNEINNFLTKNAGKQTTDIDDIKEKISDESEGPEEQSEREETTLAVFEKLKMLNGKDQEIIVMRYKLDYSVKDIAQILKMEYSAAKVALHRAIKKLSEICGEK
jgi:RNA polymerase sigma-70 factor (ECF subfamily)